MSQFDRGAGRERREQQPQAELEKEKLPNAQREELRRARSVATAKGAEQLNDPNFGKRPNDNGRDALLDPTRQAKPEMMAVVSVMIPELSKSRSPQAAALLKEFENPAVVRAYLINPEKTANALGQRYPDMRAALEKNMPFVQEGKHLKENPSSGLYQRVSQEVRDGVKPQQSFVRHHMDGLLSSAFPASLGGSAGLETKAYELVRNRIENQGFNSEGASIELKIARLMQSPQAREDLKEVAAIARGPAPVSARTSASPPQPTTSTPPSQGVPTTNGQQVTGPLKQVPQAGPATTPPPEVTAKGVPTTTGQQVTGALQQVAAPSPGATPQTHMTAPPAPGLPNIVMKPEPLTQPKVEAKISVPGIKAPSIPTTGGAPIVGDLRFVTEPISVKVPIAPPLAPEVKPPAVPTTGGAPVTGELKMVDPAKPLPSQQMPEPARVPPAAPTPAPSPAPTPVPDQMMAAQNQQMKDTIAKLDESLKKATDATEAMMKKLQESEARNAELMKRLEESERRAQRVELKSDVNDILREQKQKIASTKEIDAAVAATTKPDQKELPTAEQVVSKVTELREQVKQKEIEAKRELAKKINESFAALPEKATVAQTREWTGKNMDLYNSLDDTGKKAFVNYINNTFGPVQNQEEAPMSFFNRKIADAAIVEITNAKRAKEVYIPSGASIPNALPQRPTTFYEPDPIRIAQVVRSVSDLKDVLPLLQTSKDVKAVRDTLPKAGTFFKEALDARLAGNTVEAEALLLRSLIENGDMKDKALRTKVVREALGANKEQSDQIREYYKKTFDSELIPDLRKTNSRQFAEQEAAEAEVKRKKAELQKSEDRLKAAAESIDDLKE